MAARNTPLTASYHTLPPTYNLLNSRQRTRLVRTTRKLEAILGTTPIVAEPEEAQSPSAGEPLSTVSSRRSSFSDSDEKQLRRHASICSCADSPDLIYASPAFASSVISLKGAEHQPPLRSKCSMKLRFTARHRASTELSRPLLLRLEPLHCVLNTRPSVPSTPLTPSTPSLTPGSPTSASESTTATPTTPTFPSPAELRRKQIAKLSRTFGEIIPPHLIPSIGPPKSATLSPTSPCRADFASPRPKSRTHRSMSVDHGTESVPRRSVDEPWTIVQEAWVGEWNRTDIREVQRKLRSLRVR
ncbi:hypothetical protein NM688_g2322 [Phlebia brevispora]|uniref:Uncharacterized protein n=1 Tax=Phlebia brevispora TaxID=194682 RepID=A0ACC1T9A9_9APHY|nr:hypothetical protein NM688_g2322 [Phlebia brevispora]